MAFFRSALLGSTLVAGSNALGQVIQEKKPLDRLNYTRIYGSLFSGALLGVATGKGTRLLHRMALHMFRNPSGVPSVVFKTAVSTLVFTGISAGAAALAWLNTACEVNQKYHIGLEVLQLWMQDNVVPPADNASLDEWRQYVLGTGKYDPSNAPASSGAELDMIFMHHKPTLTVDIPVLLYALCLGVAFTAPVTGQPLAVLVAHCSLNAFLRKRMREHPFSYIFAEPGLMEESHPEQHLAAPTDIPDAPESRIRRPGPQEDGGWSFGGSIDFGSGEVRGFSRSSNRPSVTALRETAQRLAIWREIRDIISVPSIPDKFKHAIIVRSHDTKSHPPSSEVLKMYANPGSERKFPDQWIEVQAVLPLDMLADESEVAQLHRFNNFASSRVTKAAQAQQAVSDWLMPRHLGGGHGGMRGGGQDGPVVGGRMV